jgi:hypothetical protein
VGAEEEHRGFDVMIAKPVADIRQMAGLQD